MRHSKLSKSDCLFILRKLNGIEERIMEFAMAGFPTEGWKTDMFLCTDLIELSNYIDDKVRDKKDGIRN